MTEEDWTALETGGMQPDSVICAGLIDEAERDPPQDAYRICWMARDGEVDEMGDYDECDLTHQLAVISQALAIIAARRVNGGTIDVLTQQGVHTR